jgi:hypothetical protein
MKKIVLVFGLISGAIASALMLLTIPLASKIGFDKAMVIGYASILAGALLIYFGIRSYRDNVLGGAVRFGRALAVGLMIGAVSGVLYAATWELVSDRYYPDFLEKYQAHQLEAARAKGATQAQLDAQVVEMKQYAEMYKNPWIKAAFTFMEPLPVTVVVSLISAWVLSRRRKDPEPVPAG